MTALLVDKGIGRDLVQTLVAQGFTVHHWLEFGSKGANDSLVFRQAQQRGLTMFTYNRDDYFLLATAWHNWGHGNHHSIIAHHSILARPKGASLLPPMQTLQIMLRYCADASSFVNRIELL